MLGSGLAIAAAPPYLAGMAILPPTSTPRAAFRDFVAAVRHDDRRDRILGATLAVLVTIIIVIVFFVDSTINTAPPASIIYTEQWSANRTDAEIVADQAVHQAQREALQKEKQRKFQKLEKQLGI